ncbi:hypothetical protein ACIP98_10800 [Streptomyces sp. NPDC088354]|uniref:hypothetical protein n=1 Tax=unclassified Streptomyces TaxID=2593676 RepID=UPI0029B88B70|nr:hypothetical protein [Streptomyces sp. MI02-7b]MDX3072401.1 hypothetical protein [Streptomyces sp. MI02-7b]
MGSSQEITTAGPGARQYDADALGRPVDGMFAVLVIVRSFLIRERTMADLVFVATTVAVFALVAFIAKAVTKL